MKLSPVNNGHVDHQRLQHKTCIFKPTQEKNTEASQENITIIIILVCKTKKNTIHGPLWAYKMSLFSTVKDINLNLNLTHLGSLVKLRGPES